MVSSILSPSPTLARTANSLNSTALGTSFVIVDGLNVIRLMGKERPRLDLLLNVLSEVTNSSGDFLCIFDANTWYELDRRQGPKWADAYAKLCRDYPYQFIEWTGGTQADVLILAECSVRDACVVSNDRYRDYAEIYPWLKTDQAHFLRLNLIRDVLYIGNRRIALKKDCQSLVHSLSAALNKLPIHTSTLVGS